MASRKKKRKESYLWSTMMVICAICTLLVAVLVVATVFFKIKKDAWNPDKQVPETTTSEIVIETEAIYGWVETEQGTKFREEDGTFAKDTWKVWEDGLYYLNDNGIMETGSSCSIDGWICQFAESGRLKDIQMDFNYQGKTQEEIETGKKSMVRGNEFYAYLDTSSAYKGAFYPIRYKKSTEEEEEYLGGKNTPEVASPNALAIGDGWVYYLALAPSNEGLNAEEQGLNGSLFRMRPSDQTKELLSNQVTGFLEAEGQIYYASNGTVFKAESGTSYPVGENQYQVKIQDNIAYLLDGMGSLVSGDDSGMKVIGDRQYKLDDGKISYVKPAVRSVGDMTYELKNDGGNGVISWKDNSGQNGILARSEYGINSFCIAEDWIYYSAYVSKGTNGERYSQIYRISMDGTEKQPASSVFEGNILNLYYYENQKTIYGEYYPVSWKSGYGQIVTVGLDGTVNKISDSGVRNGDFNENQALELLLVNGETITCYEHESQWDSWGQSWEILDTRAIQFSGGSKELVAESILVGGQGSQGGQILPGGEEETVPSSQETLQETTQAAVVPERPAETIPAERPAETVPRPAETIGTQAPGSEVYTRPSETIGGQPESNAVIIPAL